MLPSRLRLLLFLLVATLIIVRGSSIHAAKADGQPVDLILNSRNFNGATVNLSQMFLDDQGSYKLPHSTRVLPGAHRIRFIPPAGFYCVRYEMEGVIYHLAPGTSLNTILTYDISVYS